MRYGVLSDIHANLFALQSAITTLRREGVDGWLCAGDVIGYGPQPNECVETLAELGASCVAGNHELMILGELPDERAGRLARETNRWTRQALRDDCREYLAGLPRIRVTSEFVMTHGSLDDPEEYVVGEAHADRQLQRLDAEHPGPSLLILGHTHRPWVYSRIKGTVTSSLPGGAPLSEESFLLNPGSVGQSRQRESPPRARFMLLDLDARRARTYSAPYDVEGCRRLLVARGLPLAGIHVHPGPLATARRRAVRLFGELRN